MGIPLISIASKILKVVGSVLGVDSVKDVLDALDNNKMTPEQRLAIESGVNEHTEEMKRLSIEEMKVAMSEELAMLASNDKYVSRARPTGLYAFYAIAVALAVSLIAGVKVDPTAILTIVSPLAGVGGMYVYKRTQEKMNGNGNSE